VEGSKTVYVLSSHVPPPAPAPGPAPPARRARGGEQPEHGHRARHPHVAWVQWQKVVRGYHFGLADMNLEREEAESKVPEWDGFGARPDLDQQAAAAAAPTQQHMRWRAYDSGGWLIDDLQLFSKADDRAGV
jgi:hypothetical protein